MGDLILVDIQIYLLYPFHQLNKNYMPKKRLVDILGCKVRKGDMGVGDIAICAYQVFPGLHLQNQISG